MHASRVSVYSWEGAHRRDDVIEHPDTSAIDVAIRRLDGDRISEVCIEAGDGSYLILGGGAGRYVGFVSRGEDELHNLITPTGSAEPSIELCSGGQTGYFAERQLVDLATALRAARTFAERGELEPSVNWEPTRLKPDANGNISVADILGPWIEPDLESGLVARCREAWPKLLRDLSNGELATLLRQRYAVQHLLPVAKQRLAVGIDDDTEMFEGELKEAIEYASRAI